MHIKVGDTSLTIRQQNQKDREECRRYHAHKLAELKQLLGVWRLEDIPGFLNSLEKLATEFSYYSLAYIGDTVGLTRQRMQQVFEAYHLQKSKAKLTPCPVWSDELNRFIPVTPTKKKALTRKFRQAATRQKRLERSASLRARHMVRQVLAIRQFHAENGRVPKVKELSKALGYDFGGGAAAAVPSLVRCWGWLPGGQGVSCRTALDRLYAAASVGPRLHREDWARLISKSERLLSEDRVPRGGLGTLLYRERLKRNLSQHEAAEVAGVSHGAYWNYEHNLTNPGEENRRKLAMFLNCSVGELPTVDHISHRLKKAGS